MRWFRRRWRWLAGAIVVLVAAVLVARAYLVKWLIVREIRANYGGKVVVGDWWFGWDSAGITGVQLGETPADDAPIWFAADRITTDVSIRRLLTGHLMPSRIEVDRPVARLALDEKGQPTTKLPFKLGSDGSGGPAQGKPVAIPEVVAKGGEVTIQQAGRGPMTIAGIDARLAPEGGRERVDVATDDPTWGKVQVVGRFEPSFAKGTLEITSDPNFQADPDRLARIPFVPKEVWQNVEPRGPVAAKVRIDLDAASPKPVHVVTDIDLKGGSARLDPLQAEATATTGHIRIDDTLVKVDRLKGRTLDGTIAASGTLDFGRPVPQFDLDLRLRDIDASKAPKEWGLEKSGASGKLSGKVDLKVALDPKEGPDLEGTVGEGMIENGQFQGIPIKSLSLGIKAGDEGLEYDTLPATSAHKDALTADPPPPPPGPLPDRPVAIARRDRPGSTSGRDADRSPSFADPILAALPIVELATKEEGLIGWAAFVVSEAVAYQVRRLDREHGGGGHGKLRLPKTVSTHIELADVDLADILKKGEKLGIHVPVPVSGRLSISADATIPLGALADIRGYVFRGDATLAAASIDHVDFGLLTAHIDLHNGVLDIADLRGRLVDRPTAGGSLPIHPDQTADVTKAGALPVGGFRAGIHAAIAPAGPVSARIEGHRLPLGELFAPVLPVPTPLSGDLDLDVRARADIAHLDQPRTYLLDGTTDSHRITYQGKVLDEVASEVHVRDGRLTVAHVTAQLAGRPLLVSGGLDLAAPYAYHGKLTIDGWDLARVLDLVPGMPKPTPAAGRINASAEASGTAQPFAIQTQGHARVEQASVRRVPVGTVGFEWVTDRDTIALKGLEVRAFGGRLTGEATVPTHPGRQLEASATLKGVDTRLITLAFLDPSVLSLAGQADGRARVAVPLDLATIDADARLDAPALTVRSGKGQPVPVRSLAVVARSDGDRIRYDVAAETLGGRVGLVGAAPATPSIATALIDSEATIKSVHLNDAWRALGIAGGLAELNGAVDLDANLRTSLTPLKLWTHGRFAFNGLRYGTHLDLGNLRGVAAMTPTSWRIEQLTGNLFGGIAFGEAHTELAVVDGVRPVAFRFEVDRASLAKMMAEVPRLAREVEGFGTLRVSGRVAEAIRATIDVDVPRARVMGLPIANLRFPADIELSPVTGIGTFHARRWSAHLAGGMLLGSTRLRLGHDQTFQSDAQLTNVDLDILSHLPAAGGRKASGKVSGKVSLYGPSPTNYGKMRGRVDLDLDDASLVELPLLKQLDRFLGGAQGGGLFEDGDVHGTIFNETLFLEEMTLVGKILQVHATGTITFNGGLNLEVLVNTNQIIPQSGLTLVGVVPGLGQALGRGEEVLVRLANFLENRLLKFRVTGTANNPVVQLDPGVAVGQAATGFFSGALKVPLGRSR